MPVVPPAPVVSTPSADARRALQAVQVGALLVVLAATPWKPFELDRFFVPKELVLHATALVAGLFAWRAGRGAREASAAAHADWGDVALAAFLLGSVASAALATNPWLALRAVAVSAAGAALFWTGRTLARHGLDRPLVATLAVACALAAATGLAQAYGVETTYFSVNRAPGGTFGNRNFVAHLCAIGTPLLALTLLRARAAGGALLAGLGLAATTGFLVLSRSRGAWLAAAASLVPLAIGVLRAARMPNDPRDASPPRLARAPLALALAVVGVAATLALPNTLDWRSENPYLESAKGIVDYRGGSGAGRLRQYANSARMAAASPLLGVGPGNWSVHYPRVAPAGDPSLTAEGATANPWPSSDWVAVGSERGLPVLAALGTLVLLLAWWAHRTTWRAADRGRVLVGATLGATLAATVVVGLFDAVLLLAAPALLAWPALGALAESSGAPADAARPAWRAGRALRTATLAATGVALVAGVSRSVMQTAAMRLFTSNRPAAIRAAAALDPGSYRIRLRAAELARGRGQCAEARAQAEALVALWPTAGAPRRVLASCGGRRKRR